MEMILNIHITYNIWGFKVQSVISGKKLQNKLEKHHRVSRKQINTDDSLYALFITDKYLTVVSVYRYKIGSLM